MFNANDEALRGVNLCFVSAGLAEGTNANTLQIAAAIDYAIDGVMYEKAITDNIAMTACDQQAELTTCLYLVSINASGTVTTTKGDEVLSADLTAGNAVLQWPALPADNCPSGAFRIVSADGYTFTSGSTDLSATGITDTYYDLAAVPAEPLTS